MALFKVKLKDPGIIGKLEAKFVNDIKDILSAPALLNEIGEFTTDRIRFQARTRKPLNKSGSLPPLKESTIKSREYIARHNVTQDTYQKSRSNLTITGQLLDSIKHFIKGPGTIEVTYDGTHVGYKTGIGTRGPDIANKTLAKHLDKKGFVAFDSEGLNNNKAFKDRVIAIARSFLRRGLAVRRKLRS